MGWKSFTKSITQPFKNDPLTAASIALAPFTAGASLAFAPVGAQIDASRDMARAAKKTANLQESLAAQEAAAQSEALKKAQEDAANAKDKTLNMRRALIEGQTKTNYTTALGAVEAGDNLRKKTLLGG